MDRKNLKDMAGDPRFISGIYNYCDRWCERCPFTSRCLTYACDADDESDPAREGGAAASPPSRDIHNAAFWERLHSIFQQTKEMLIESAEEMGINLDELDLEAAAEEERRKSEQAEGHELAKSARQYANRVNEWFEGNAGLFEEKEDQLNAELRMGLAGTDPEAEAATVTDAVDVIRWYQYLIGAKVFAPCTATNGRTRKTPRSSPATPTARPRWP